MSSKHNPGSKKNKGQPSPMNSKKLHQNQDGDNSFQKEDFSKYLNEKDVEIEHLKTTVIALDQKSKVFIQSMNNDALGY